MNNMYMMNTWRVGTGTMDLSPVPFRSMIIVKTHNKILSFFLLLLLLLFGCGEDKMTNQESAAEITYKKGLPRDGGTGSLVQLRK